MLNYNKNKLINKCLVKYYETFAHTLDTSDYVPEKFTLKILKYIFKNMKRQFHRIDKEDRQYQRQVNEKAKAKLKQMQAEEKAQVKAKKKQAKLQAPLIRFRAKQAKAEQRKQAKAQLKQAKAEVKRLKKQAKNKTDKEVKNNVK